MTFSPPRVGVSLLYQPNKKILLFVDLSHSSNNKIDNSCVYLNKKKKTPLSELCGRHVSRRGFRDLSVFALSHDYFWMQLNKKQLNKTLIFPQLFK